MNKVSSKVKLIFNLRDSRAFDEQEKTRLLDAYDHRLTKKGEIIVQSDATRSQHMNKERTIKRLIKMMETGLIVKKKRKATKVSKSQKQKRLNEKKKRSVKKQLRKPPGIDG